MVDMVELSDLGILLLDQGAVGGTRLIDRHVSHHAERPSSALTDPLWWFRAEGIPRDRGPPCHRGSLTVTKDLSKRPSAMACAARA